MIGVIIDMAGFSTIYLIGRPGGFMGADSTNSIDVMLLVSDASRQWVEAKYLSKKLKPIGNVKTIIPSQPIGFNELLDACLVFCPGLFNDCPSMVMVQEKMKDIDRIDFDHDISIPEEWNSLREEALPIFKMLIAHSCIYGANIEPIDISRL
jgi:hypothetical protein